MNDFLLFLVGLAIGYYGVDRFFKSVEDGLHGLDAWLTAGLDVDRYEESEELL